jgi:hypothetical protein
VQRRSLGSRRRSKIENEESVVRCKERKQLMKESVAARNAFAAAHSAYITLLKNTGAALNDYGQDESTEFPSHGLLPVSQIFGNPLPPAPPLPPQPPPLPPGYLSRSTLERSTSAPVIAFHNDEQPAEENKNPEATAAPIPEGEEDEEEEHAVEVSEAVVVVGL